MEIIDSLSYDDVLLVPSYSDILPGETILTTHLTKDIKLNIPILSAAMDTVTEKDMAIALALEGGAGVVHRNLSPQLQADHVLAVKRFLNWVIENPVTVNMDMTIQDVKRIINEYNVSGLPVLDNQKKLRGIITHRDLRFCLEDSLKVQEVMTPDPITEKGHPTTESAKEKFNRYKIEKLPVTDEEGKLTGLITVKDMEKHQLYPLAATDKQGRLIVGAAVSPQDYQKRLPLLLQSRVDFIVLDTAHGNTKSTLTAIEKIKAEYSVPVIGGNVATAEGARNLISAGADAIKVGIGPGSICTTRIVAGIGVPQFSAILFCAEEASKYGIPVIADGGIKYSGDITKAIAAGSVVAMLGNLFAGLKESPGQEIIYDGRMFKEYRGMGSLAAIKKGSGDRYQINPGEDPVPEGIEGRVPYKGELRPYLHQMITGLRKGMAYCGCRTINELREYKKFVKISTLGLRESHAHDIMITQEAPNYSRK